MVLIYLYSIYAIVFESQEKVFKTSIKLMILNTSVNARPHCPLTLSGEPDRISAQTLHCQKLVSLLKICAADSMCLSLLVFMQLYFETCAV